MFLSKPQKAFTKKTKKIPKQALSILDNGFFAYLGTAEQGCDPHLTAMFYIWDDSSQTIQLVSTKKSRKVNNIRRNTRVCVTIDKRDPRSPARNCGVMIQGRAKLVEMEVADDMVMVNFLDKYIHFLGPGYPMGSRIVIRVHPKKISYWMGANFYKWTSK
ncbi:MAG: pyridoxamine 5'-phosphate oxidase family protein [Candidatus Thorarchaeota archaeon]